MSNGPTTNDNEGEDTLFSPRSTAAMALSSMMNSQLPTSLDFEPPRNLNNNHPDFHPPQNELRKAPPPPPGKPSSHNRAKPPPPPPKDRKLVAAIGEEVPAKQTDAAAGTPNPAEGTDTIFRRPSPPQPPSSSSSTAASQQIFRRPSPPSYHHHRGSGGVTPQHNNNLRRSYPYYCPPPGVPSPWAPPTWDDHRRRPPAAVVYRTTQHYPPPPSVVPSSSGAGPPVPIMCYSGPPSSQHPPSTNHHPAAPPPGYYQMAVTPTPHKKQKFDEISASFRPPPSTLKREPTQSLPRKNPSYNRKKKSLGVLAESFLQKFRKTTDHPEIVIDDLSIEFEVERRRIYDVVNILEALSVVVKKGKNTYQWMGHEHLSRQFGILQDEGIHRWQKQAAKNGFLDKSPDLVNRVAISQNGNKSLTRLSQLFLQVFLVGEANVSLPDASDLIHGGKATVAELVELGRRKDQPAPLDAKSIQQAAARGLKTKIRRLYDIANVYLSVGLLRKTENRTSSTVEGKRPHFHWNYEHGPRKIRQIYCKMSTPMKKKKTPFTEEQAAQMLNDPYQRHEGPLTKSAHKSPNKKRPPTELLPVCVPSSSQVAKKQTETNNHVRASSDSVAVATKDAPHSPDDTTKRADSPNEAFSPSNNDTATSDAASVDAFTPEMPTKDNNNGTEDAPSSTSSISSSNSSTLQAIQQIKGTESDGSPEIEKENALSNIHEVGAAMEVCRMPSLSQTTDDS